MSAIILIHQDSAVHLVSDACSYDLAAKVTRIESNIRELPRARAAYRVRGAIGGYLDVLHKLLSHATSIEQLLMIVGGIMIELRKAALAHSAAGLPAGNPTDFELSIIGWSTEIGAPTAWVIATHETATKWDLPGYQAYVPQRAPVILARPGVGNIHAVLERAPFTDIAEVWELDPAETALAIMEAQRAQSITEGPLVDAHVVGGFCEMVTIDATGVTRQTLRTWPDRVGDMIMTSKREGFGG